MHVHKGYSELRSALYVIHMKHIDHNAAKLSFFKYVYIQHTHAGELQPANCIYKCFFSDMNSVNSLLLPPLM